MTMPKAFDFRLAMSAACCLVAAALLIAAHPVQAADQVLRPRQQIAVVHSNQFEDAGFNRMVREGVRLFESHKGTQVRALTHPRGAVFSAAELDLVLAAAIDDGVTAVMVAGSTYQAALISQARQHPQLRIVIVDADEDLPGNIQTVHFRSHEASYLAGIVAARASKSGVVGFVAGLDVAGIRAFGCAFAQGARATRSDVRVHARVIDSGRMAFSDPEGGRHMARALLDERADVIFAAAGGSGLGVLDEVAKSGAYGIGVDANQNGLHPGRILTSVVKRLDVSVYTSLVALHDGQWRRGLQSVGLSEGAVGLALDEYNRHLLSRDTLAELEAAEFAIRSGELEVIDAQSDEAPCAALIAYPTAAAGR